MSYKLRNRVFFSNLSHFSAVFPRIYLFFFLYEIQLNMTRKNEREREKYGNCELNLCPLNRQIQPEPKTYTIFDNKRIKKRTSQSNNATLFSFASIMPYIIHCNDSSCFSRTLK